MVGRKGSELRLDLTAPIDGQLAAGPELAAGGEGQRVGHGAFDGLQAPIGVSAKAGQRAEEPPGVGVERVGEELARGGLTLTVFVVKLP